MLEVYLSGEIHSNWREEIIAYLESEDRRQKIDEFVENLRRASVITVFPEQL